ncbi:MAG: MGMT family protein [Candidatus Woesearchaeota archaeon]|nr:MGMT family protein [Candidatus Woesearchaeota archaeon]
MASLNFNEKVLALVRKIPEGNVTTYKEIGRALKRKGQIYRAVGRALHENKCPVIIPCHRVVKSDGSIGGYSGGVKEKIKLLRKEGIEINKNKVVGFEKRMLKF